MSEFVIQKIHEFVDELLPSMGLELVEIQYRQEQQGWVLRVFIDTPEGVTLDHCSMVSRELGDYLEVEDLIDHQYHLEVSSPGLERKLYKIEDFKRFLGRTAKIKMHRPIDGEKIFVGEIFQVDGDLIVLKMEGERRLEFTFDMVSVARLAI
jgi:ribosome maturation factor RimP